MELLGDLGNTDQLIAGKFFYILSFILSDCCISQLIPYPLSSRNI